ncbi:MAG: IclR family transcriptional regulator [Burkholderiaceae bacterium]|nr:IclR family transcriptional regulator [Burkholderiaceae bacterium]
MPDAPRGGRRRNGSSKSNRSLERGIEILRAFRPGSEVLGNGELTERTGLPKATVSRLTQTLVGAGLLQSESALRAYRLAPAVLSLAHAMRSGSRVLAVAAPLMRRVAERERLNVGLAAPDRDEMVYLESIRYARRVAFRSVVSGQRVPIELTSLGRAYLAQLSEPQLAALMSTFRRRRSGQWNALKADIERAIREVRAHGWCTASWQPEVVAVATPFETVDAVYVLNMSLSTTEAVSAVARRLAPKLLALKNDVALALDKSTWHLMN